MPKNRKSTYIPSHFLAKASRGVELVVADIAVTSDACILR